jgi:arabinofuranan 3-O-arabinosyltransferase
MVDGNPGTTWVAPVSDISPDITISFVAPQKIRGIAVGVARGTAARRPQSFKLTWAGGSRVIELDDDGTARFPAITTTALTLEVIAAEPATDLDIAGGTSDVPVGIGELRLIGTNAIPVTLPTTPNRLPCGSGPEVEVNGSVIQTSLRISPADLASTGSFEARPCGVGSVQLRAGENTVAVTASDAFWGESVVLGDARPPTSGAVQASGGSTRRSLEFDGSAYVATTGNTNPGWIADDGSSSQVFDGWRQGWRSSGDSELTMRFAPQRVYVVGLVAGGFALVALLVALALTLGGRARTSAPALTESRGGTRWWLSAVVASSLLLAGWIGLIVGVMAGMLGWAIHRWRPTWEGWGLAALLAPAAAAFSFNPWGVTPWAGNLHWPPYFVVAACVGIGCWAVVPLDGVAKRIAGLSKHQ